MTEKDLYIAMRVAEEKVIDMNLLKLIIGAKTAENLFKSFIGEVNAPKLTAQTTVNHRFMYIGKFIGTPTYVDLLADKDDFVTVLTMQQFDILDFKKVPISEDETLYSEH